MLHTIAFQDNLFQVSRYLDVIQGGLKLELSESIFAKKIFNDIVFFDSVIQRLFNQIIAQPGLPNRLDLMHCLYLSVTKYINIIGAIVNLPPDKNVTNFDVSVFNNICKKHQEMQMQIAENIQIQDFSNDSLDIVSQNELSELLNFN